MKLPSPFLSLGAAGALLSSSCLCGPSPQDVLATGHRTPEMTFRTLQVGVRGDLPALEYSCLSEDFRARYGLSLLAYMEFRERELEGRIEYWLGLPEAEIITSEPLSEGRHLLRCESFGQPFELVLVREDYWKLWVDGDLLANEPITDGSFGQWTEVWRDEQGGTFVLGHAQLPAGLEELTPEELAGALSEFRIGREWKIDDLMGLDP